MTEAMKGLPVLAETIKRHVVTPRLGEPSDIAALAAFLAADESAYITGQTIRCDGGHLAHQPQIDDILDLEASRRGDNPTGTLSFVKSIRTFAKPSCHMLDQTPRLARKSVRLGKGVAIT